MPLGILGPVEGPQIGVLLGTAAEELIAGNSSLEVEDQGAPFTTKPLLEELDSVVPWWVGRRVY